MQSLESLGFSPVNRASQESGARSHSIRPDGGISGPYYLRAIKGEQGFLQESDGKLVMEKVPHKGETVIYTAPQIPSGARA